MKNTNKSITQNLTKAPKESVQNKIYLPWQSYSYWISTNMSTINRSYSFISTMSNKRYKSYKNENWPISQRWYYKHGQPQTIKIIDTSYKKKIIITGLRSNLRHNYLPSNIGEKSKPNFGITTWETAICLLPPFSDGSVRHGSRATPGHTKQDLAP
jgi:hypothetical protein